MQFVQGNFCNLMQTGVSRCKYIFLFGKTGGKFVEKNSECIEKAIQNDNPSSLSPASALPRTPSTSTSHLGPTTRFGNSCSRADQSRNHCPQIRPSIILSGLPLMTKLLGHNREWPSKDPLADNEVQCSPPVPLCYRIRQIVSSGREGRHCFRCPQQAAE